MTTGLPNLPPGYDAVALTGAEGAPGPVLPRCLACRALLADPADCGPHSQWHRQIGLGPPDTPRPPGPSYPEPVEPTYGEPPFDPNAPGRPPPGWDT